MLKNDQRKKKLTWINNTYMDNVYFNSSNTNINKIGMHGLIKVSSLIRIDKSKSIFNNHISSQIRHSLFYPSSQLCSSNLASGPVPGVNPPQEPSRACTHKHHPSLEILTTNHSLVRSILLYPIPLLQMHA